MTRGSESDTKKGSFVVTSTSVTPRSRITKIRDWLAAPVNMPRWQYILTVLILISILVEAVSNGAWLALAGGLVLWAVIRTLVGWKR